MTGDMAVKFQEVTDGLFVVTTESRALLYQEESAYNSVYWDFHLVFLKGERREGLSAALQKWVELFSEPNSPKYLIPKGGFFACMLSCTCLCNVRYLSDEEAPDLPK